MGAVGRHRMPTGAGSGMQGPAGVRGGRGGFWKGAAARRRGGRPDRPARAGSIGEEGGGVGRGTSSASSAAVAPSGLARPGRRGAAAAEDAAVRRGGWQRGCARRDGNEPGGMGMTPTRCGMTAASGRGAATFGAATRRRSPRGGPWWPGGERGGGGGAAVPGFTVPPQRPSGPAPSHPRSPPSTTRARSQNLKRAHCANPHARSRAGRHCGAGCGGRAARVPAGHPDAWALTRRKRVPPQAAGRLGRHLRRG